MKFFKSKEPEKTVLFVCIENAGRSQMAEGFSKNMLLEIISRLVQVQNPSPISIPL